MKNKLPTTNKPVPVKIVGNGECAPKADDKWRIEDALRTLQSAEKFKSDKPLMKAVKALAKEQVKALSKIK